MPNKYTFNMQLVKELLHKYVKKPDKWIDPFAGLYSTACTTNDLRKNMKAKYNMFALDFLKMLTEKDNKYNGCLFDPPYSLRQAKECYEKTGDYKFTQEDTQNVGRWTKEKNIVNKLLMESGIFIHFGWHSNGMGKKYGFEIIEILLIAHGGCHNDTIITVEKRINNNLELF